jgi:phenylalanyl-tRNA synthetase beta chain
MHPGMSAKILVDREEIGIIGRVHPSIEKDEIYVCEFSMTKLYEKEVKPIKYKESNKYPFITKDLSFIIDKNITNDKIIETIKKSGGRLLTNIEVFDIYTGDSINENEKSMAYSLKFEDSTRTLTDEEVMLAFNKIIEDVEIKLNAKVRNGE